jgi:hypothetical protein
LAITLFLFAHVFGYPFARACVSKPTNKSISIHGARSPNFALVP